MRYTSSLVALLLLVVLNSCGREILSPDIKPTGTTSQVSAPANPSGTSYSRYRGLYIDSTSVILGDTLKENSLLRWCMHNNITTLSFYNLRQVMASNKARHLASFLKRAKTEYKIKENTAVIGSDAFITSYLDTFNRSKVDTLERFDFVNLEKEWWNGDGTLKEYIQALSKIRQWGRSQAPVVKTEEYIGWFLRPSGNELYMANELIKNSDRILVHDYQKTPSFQYVLSRLSYLGQAAKLHGKTFPVIIIFSAEPQFSADYFRTHNFDEAYQIIVKRYINTEFAGKNNIRLVGYQIFDQSFARNARLMDPF